MRRTLIGSAAALLLVLASAGAAGKKVDAVRWRPLADGEAESKKTGRPVLYFFTADWCAPCHTLVDQVFTDQRAAAEIEKRYVPVVLEDDRRGEGKNAVTMESLAVRFGVQGLPTLVVARPGTGKGLRLAGWAGRQKTLDFLDRAAGRLQEMESEGSAKR